MAAMAGNEKSPCGLRDIRQATGGLWESRERRRVRVAFMAKWVRLHPSEPLLWGNALHSFDFQLFRFLSCYFLFITQKHHTFVWRFCCASFSSTHFGAAGRIRTADLILTKRPWNFFLTIFRALWPYPLQSACFPPLFDHKVSVCFTAVCGWLCGQSVGAVGSRDLTVCTNVVRVQFSAPPQ